MARPSAAAQGGRSSGAGRPRARAGGWRGPPGAVPGKQRGAAPPRCWRTCCWTCLTCWTCWTSGAPAPPLAAQIRAVDCRRARPCCRPRHQTASVWRCSSWSQTRREWPRIPLGQSWRKGRAGHRGRLRPSALISGRPARVSGCHLRPRHLGRDRDSGGSRLGTGQASASLAAPGWSGRRSFASAAGFPGQDPRFSKREKREEQEGERARGEK